MTDYNRLFQKLGYEPIPTPEEFLEQVEDEIVQIQLEQLQQKLNKIVFDFSDIKF